MKHSWAYFGLSFLAAGLILIWLISFITTSLPIFSWTLVAAAGLYFLSHLFRATRLWLVMSEAELDFRHLSLSHLLGSSLGNISWPLVKDLGVGLLILSRYPDQLVKVVLSLVYNRLFDWCVLMPLLLPVILGQTKATQQLAGWLFGLGLLVLIGFMLLPRITSLIQQHLLRHHHHQGGLAALKLVSLIKTTAESMKLGQFDKVFILLINTLVIWLIELAAIWLLIGGGWSETLTSLSQNILLVSAGQTATSFLALYFGLSSLSLISYGLVLSWPKAK